MLDASLRIEVLDLLRDLKDKFNVMCLFITHDFGVTRYFAKDGRVMIMYLGSIVEVGPTDDIILEPIHPYTKTLIASVPVPVPVPDRKLTRSRSLPMLRSLEVPSLTQVPPGCRFHLRCPNAENVCAEKIPENKAVGKERFVACHLY